LAVIAALVPLIDTVERELARLSQQEPWGKHMPYLIQLPGIGLVGGMPILAAVGDITGFRTAKHLVGYAGLGTRVHASGQVHRSGGITKRGRRDLRTILVEAAWAAVRSSPVWRVRFEHLSARMPAGKAIVAIARKLLVVVWPVLREQVADRQAEAEAVAKRFFRWGARYQVATQVGLSRGAFVRQQLDRVRIGQELETLSYNGKLLVLRASG
jgi:transposase